MAYKIKDEPVELIVLKFAIPCLKERVALGNFPQEEFSKCERMCTTRQIPERDYLERILPDEARRRADLAKRINEKDPWSRNVVLKYWSTSPEGHNAVIERGEDGYKDAPAHAKENCKVREASFLRYDRGKAILQIDNKEIRLNPSLIPDALQGEKILIHKTHAIIGL